MIKTVAMIFPQTITKCFSYLTLKENLPILCASVCLQVLRSTTAHVKKKLYKAPGSAAQDYKFENKVKIYEYGVKKMWG